MNGKKRHMQTQSQNLSWRNVIIQTSIGGFHVGFAGCIQGRQMGSFNQSWAPRRVVCGWIGMYVASKRRRTVKQVFARKKIDGGTSDPKANRWCWGEVLKMLLWLDCKPQPLNPKPKPVNEANFEKVLDLKQHSIWELIIRCDPTVSFQMFYDVFCCGRSLQNEDPVWYVYICLPFKHIFDIPSQCFCWCL